MLTRRRSYSPSVARPLGRTLRAAVLMGLVLAGAAPAPAAGSPAAPDAGPAISPEQAIALALQNEIGDNDLRLSDMGGDTLYDAAYSPAVAYNSADHEYLVVWYGDDNTGGLVDGENEIFGQRVDAATGADLSGDLRLSDMGPDGSTSYGAFEPAVAYNSQDNEYLVVWYGDDNAGGLVDNEIEIFGQRVDAATGAELGGDIRLSDMGPNGSTSYAALSPAVAYNSQDNEYLVVWWGDDNTGGLVDEEFEIFGQRVDAATGAELGGDIRLSDMGPNGSTSYAALSPAVAYNSQDNEYLVVWYGDDNAGGLVDGEYEIFGQRVDAASGAEVGGDLRLSDMGPDGSTSYGAFEPAVAYNSADHEYLVVWYGDDNTGSLVDEEYEIFGQRLDAATGAELGGDFRLSDMGPDGSTSYGAFSPAVAYNSADHEYLVVWHGDDNTGGLVDEEYEIFGQRVDAATGAELGGDLRLSDMGPDGSTSYGAFNPAVAYNSADNVYLVVWYGDDNTGGLVDEEVEIIGQRVDAATGAELGGDLRLSDMGGDTLYDASEPAVAYNSADNEYLVVWWGDDNTGSLVDGENEIFGQRVDAATGAELGGDIRLSDMGPDGNANYDAFEPAVAYNSAGNEYLVVWWGDDNTGGLVDDENEIFGQRVEGDTGAEIGGDFRLSDMGPDGSASYAAFSPAVAYNSSDHEYLVVWHGDDNTGGLVDGENEIFGQRVDAATGAELGGDIRLSDMGPNGSTSYAVAKPAVAYNSADNDYLVVWYGDDNTGGLVDGENEIFGQRVDAATGAELGGDIRLSDMGPDGNTSYGAVIPAVAYNNADHEYLVVWNGDDNAGGLVDNEGEIFGQRVDAATGAELGGDIRLSDMGPDGSTSYAAGNPAVTYNSADHEYLVVWDGDDNAGGLADNEFEIFGQRVDAATGAELGGDVRLSDMGPDGNTSYRAAVPAVAYNSADHEYLVVWRGEDNTGSLVDNEGEIFGQRLASQLRLFLPLVIR